MRDAITFKCSECGEENYIGTRNKRKHPEKMEIKKYCPRCNKKKRLTRRKNKRSRILAFFISFNFQRSVKKMKVFNQM